MEWLTELSKDSTFQERAKWRDGLPELPTWRRRGGKKRSYFKVKKPGKEQRKRLRLANQVDSASSVPCSSSVVSRDRVSSVVNRDQVSSSTSRDQICSGVSVD